MSARGPKNREKHLISDALELLEDSMVAWEPLHGGGLSEVVRLRLGSGKYVVAKSGPHPEREGRMLRALAEAGAKVPLPIASGPTVLVLEDLGVGTGASEQSWRGLGSNLRALHAPQVDRYGWDEDYAFGKVRIHNGWSCAWSDFWFEKRLAADIAALPTDIARRLEKLEFRIREIVPDHPPPSLLHGDLWSGNVHFTANCGAYLIDPASYYGDAEVDLAMLTLFGTPPRPFWEAYGPLDEGWKQRRCVYQLWPALVHLRLFGAGYRSLVESLMAAVEP